MFLFCAIGCFYRSEYSSLVYHIDGDNGDATSSFEYLTSYEKYKMAITRRNLLKRCLADNLIPYFLFSEVPRNGVFSDTAVKTSTEDCFTNSCMKLYLLWVKKTEVGKPCMVEENVSIYYFRRICNMQEKLFIQ